MRLRVSLSLFSKFNSGAYIVEMRYSTSIAALALAYLQGSAALNNALARKFSLLAEMGLNPDGSPMEFVPTVADGADSSIKTTFKEFKVSSASSNSVTVPAVNETIVPEYVELPIDNFAEEKGLSYSWQGTFYNRYWVSSKSYKPGSPVFIYDAGEADASPNALFRLQNETSFFKQIVDQYNGIGIVWEHRFYGNSSPVLVDVNTPASDFQFLTTEQSLADVDRFAKQFSRKNIKYDLTPKSTPWVFVGGSYPGMRAAFIRNMYPETIYASYASSAPVQASVDQSFYFEPVWQGLNAYGFGNCTSDIHAAILYMDKIMSSSNTTAAANLKIQFLGLGAEKNSHATFADALATIFGAWQSYGVEGGSSGLRQFCDWIEQDTDALMPKVAGADGLAKSKGPAYVVDRWAKYPYFVPIVNSNLDTNCSGKKNVQGDCNLDLKFSDPSMVAWTWQYCKFTLTSRLDVEKLLIKWIQVHNGVSLHSPPMNIR